MNSSPDRQVTLIGVGNEFRCDDAAGVIAARRIEAQKLVGVETFIKSGEITSLIDLWQTADFAIVIDACRSNADAGTIFRFDARKDQLPADHFRHSTHAFSVAQAVELARLLDRLPPRLIVYAIEGKNFEIGIGLSPAVKQSIAALCRKVKNEVTRLLEVNV